MTTVPLLVRIPCIALILIQNVLAAIPTPLAQTELLHSKMFEFYYNGNSKLPYYLEEKLVKNKNVDRSLARRTALLVDEMSTVLNTPKINTSSTGNLKYFPETFVNTFIHLISPKKIIVDALGKFDTAQGPSKVVYSPIPVGYENVYKAGENFITHCTDISQNDRLKLIFQLGIVCQANNSVALRDFLTDVVYQCFELPPIPMGSPLQETVNFLNKLQSISDENRQIPYYLDSRSSAFWETNKPISSVHMSAYFIKRTSDIVDNSTSVKGIETCALKQFPDRVIQLFFHLNSAKENVTDPLQAFTKLHTPSKLANPAAPVLNGYASIERAGKEFLKNCNHICTLEKTVLLMNLNKYCSQKNSRMVYTTLQKAVYGCFRLEKYCRDPYTAVLQFMDVFKTMTDNNQAAQWQLEQDMQADKGGDQMSPDSQKAQAIALITSMRKINENAVTLPTKVPSGFPKMASLSRNFVSLTLRVIYGRDKTVESLLGELLDETRARKSSEGQMGKWTRVVKSYEYFGSVYGHKLDNKVIVAMKNILNNPKYMEKDKESQAVKLLSSIVDKCMGYNNYAKV